MIDWRRDGETLTVMLRRDRSQVPIVAVVWLVLSVILFLPLFPLTILAAAPPALILLHYWCNVRTLRFDPDLIVIEDSFFRFNARGRRRVYVRKGVPCPVVRITLYGQRYDNVVRANVPHYGYEIRIPFEETGGRGVIVNFPTERDMLAFERIVQRYWNEVPAELTWTEPAAPALQQREIEPEQPTFLREDDSSLSRDFSLDRGDGTVAHAVEPKPVRHETKKQARPSGAAADPMVTVFEKRGDVHGEWMLKLVSRRGGSVSTFLGRTSRCCYNMLVMVVFVAGLGVFGFFCYVNEPVTEAVSKAVSSRSFQEMILPLLF